MRIVHLDVTLTKTLYVSTATQRNALKVIYEAMSTWMSKSCITFRPALPEDKNYVIFTVGKW